MNRRRLFLALLVALGAVSTACGDGADDKRTVLVDYSSDEFASMAFFNYPATFEALPGQTVIFKQTWTGEPHTVTAGTFVQDALEDGGAWLDFFEGFEGLTGSGANIPSPSDPGDATFDDLVNGIKEARDKESAERVLNAWRALVKQGVPLPDIDAPPPGLPFSEINRIVEEEADKAFEGVAFAFDDNEEIAQNLAQPCYRKSGGPPEDPAKPCSAAEQKQPEFDGTESVYNSGFIPYEGTGGNSFEVKLADDIKPGTYLFYCAVHGPGQLSELEVRPKGTKIESQGEISRRARAEANESLEPMKKIYDTAVRTGRFDFQGEELKAPFAGLSNDGHVLINEFVPEQITAKVNEPITWKMMGSDHTISFDVPKYFPILEFGTAEGVRFNPKLEGPQGGAPEIPDQQGEGVFKMDGGTYDGTGFWSSGLVGGQPYAEYTVRISKRGTYPYACLIHPPMIGRVTVT